MRLDPAAAPPPDERGGEIREVLKGLVCKISRSVERRRAKVQLNHEEKVILDLEVDGVRCLFLKPISESPANSIVISPRERTIARLVAAGHPNKTIAHALRISTWTVSTHLRRIFAKLGVNSRAAMVAHLMETGVLKEPQQKQRREPPSNLARRAEI